jgi:anti-sigma regulatory factor (Ser/Thr protein kinase)
MLDCHEVELAWEKASPGRARGLLEEWFGSQLASSKLDTAKLLASELVTNAMLHGRGRITFRSGLDDEQLLVEVLDEGKGFELATAAPRVSGAGGWGLQIVAAEASRWGMFDGTTHVWFALARA